MKKFLLIGLGFATVTGAYLYFRNSRSDDSSDLAGITPIYSGGLSPQSLIMPSTTPPVNRTDPVNPEPPLPPARPQLDPPLPPAREPNLNYQYR